MVTKKQGQGQFIPYVINSAFVETSIKTGFDGIRHFDKTQREEKKLFAELKILIDDKPSFKLKTEYSKVFESFGGNYLPLALAPKLLEILKNLKLNIVDQHNFNSVREILENIFIKANKINIKFIPNDLLKSDGRPNLEWCVRYLAGLKTDVRNHQNIIVKSYPINTFPIAPQHISKAIEYVKSTSSIYSHAYAEPWTKYLFHSVAFGLLEILIWFKQYVDKTYP